MTYARLTDDFAAVHVDEEYARKSVFGHRVAHGSLVIGLALGLVQKLGIFKGTGIAPLELTWIMKAPVLLGDTMRVRLTIASMRETSKPDRGIIGRTYEVLNQDNAVVQQGTCPMLVKRRPSQPNKA
jgi:acyl dehydratase